MRLPMITLAEWKKLAPLLPPTGGPGKPRSDDRLMLSGLFYSAATKCTLESLPPGYGNPRSLRTRRQRWTADGTLPRLMQAGAPVIERMRRGYWGLVATPAIRTALTGKVRPNFSARALSRGYRA